jgi:hypothetical protein
VRHLTGVDREECQVAPRTAARDTAARRRRRGRAPATSATGSSPAQECRATRARISYSTRLSQTDSTSRCPTGRGRAYRRPTVGS